MRFYNKYNENVVNLRQIFFWVTGCAIFLAIFRRPIQILINDFQYFMFGYNHLVWLAGFEVYYPKLTEEYQAMVLVTGIVSSIFLHIGAIVLAIYVGTHIYDKYIKD